MTALGYKRRFGSLRTLCFTSRTGQSMLICEGAMVPQACNRAIVVRLVQRQTSLASTELTLGAKPLTANKIYMRTGVLVLRDGLAV